MRGPRIDLADVDTLFGNEAAEEERDDLFEQYVYERPELEQFLQDGRKIGIVRAYKGEGKSALLRHTAQTKELKPGPQGESVVLSVSAPTIAPELDTDDTDAWTKRWRAAIVDFIAAELGKRIGVAFDDDSMALVEYAISKGARPRSFVSAIMDRIRSKRVPIEKTGPQFPSDRGGLVERWSKVAPPVWVFIDDVDENFRNRPYFRAKIAGFYQACRSLIQGIEDLRLRVTVRPNVWSLVKREFESLSKVEQYVVDLRWSEEQIRQMLAKRVMAYLRATDQKIPVIKEKGKARDEAFISYVFEPRMKWGRGKRPPHVVLTTLSARRPRWLVELCKNAASKADGAHERLIDLRHIQSVLKEFGDRRIEDTIAEFGSLCPQIGELIRAFEGQADRYSEKELFEIIDRRILQQVSVQINTDAGSGGSKRSVANLLYMIGFLAGRRDAAEDADDSYDHIYYADNPSLLEARTANTKNLSWEVHPVFRQALGMRDEFGHATKKRDRNKR